jgi:hypothetical protein
MPYSTSFLPLSAPSNHFVLGVDLTPVPLLTCAPRTANISWDKDASNNQLYVQLTISCSYSGHHLHTTEIMPDDHSADKFPCKLYVLSILDLDRDYHLEHS